MPSRMLVALTAAIASAGTPACVRLSRTQAQMSSQLRAVSNAAEPSMPPSGACVHSRCPRPTCRPSASKITARHEPVPASIAIVYSPAIALHGDFAVAHVAALLAGGEPLDLGGEHLAAAR